jgi:uncharacterized membrane protein
LTVIGFAFATYLLYVQAFLIEAYCHWCLASDAVMAILLLLGVSRLRAALRPLDGVGEARERTAVGAVGAAPASE